MRGENKARVGKRQRDTETLIETMGKLAAGLNLHHYYCLQLLLLLRLGPITTHYIL